MLVMLYGEGMVEQALPFHYGRKYGAIMRVRLGDENTITLFVPDALKMLPERGVLIGDRIFFVARPVVIDEQDVWMCDTCHIVT